LRTQEIAISDVLTAYDDLIENNRRRIALLEEAARLLYREWFVHLSFPGHAHVKLQRRRAGGVDAHRTPRKSWSWLANPPYTA
jgi:restriction endonuclease S subunit